MVGDALDQTQIEMEEEQNDNTNPTLGRRSSIFSLTLDECQNMDEFLDSIWNAELTEMQEEDQTQTQTPATTYETMTTNSTFLGGKCTSLITNQSSLPGQQNSTTVPEPICWKTLEAIWFEIQKNEQNEQRHTCTSKNLRKSVRVPAPAPAPVQPQPTIGDMTLEDFLVKAGIIPEQRPILPPNLQGYPLVGPGPPGFPPYQTPIVYAGGGGAPPVGLATPASPISSYGMGGNPVDGHNQVGLETSEARGSKKRSWEGVSDIVAERKRRRIIKNRASAARSRARKQAYTSELETEMNKLKDENDGLKQRAEELEQTNQYMEEIIAVRERMEAETGRKELNEMRRYSSCLADILI